MPVTFRTDMLENGLTIAAEIDPAAHTSAIGFFVRTGARDEASKVMGVSHYLEHMMFKGTEKRTAEDVDRDFDRLGAEHNAYTTTEMTAFYAHMLPEHLDESVEILADIMRPSLREEDFEDERQVILEEIAMYRDQPVWVLYERAMEVFYEGHSLSHRVLGTDETIKALSRGEMATYFQDRYSADNTVVALAGAMDFDAVVRHLRSACSAWQRTDASRRYPEFRPRSGTFDLTLPTVNRQYLLMLSAAPGATDHDRYAAAMLAQILGDVDGSRFYWALIETGLADEAQAQYNGHDGMGEYCVYCSCSPEDSEEVEAVIRAEMAELLSSITEDDMERTRRKIATGVTLHGELPAGRMRRLGRLLTYENSYRPLEDELTRIEAVTLDDIARVMERYPLEPAVVGRLSGSAGAVVV